MEAMLQEARRLLAAESKLASLAVREAEGELHLFREDELFARLSPAEKPGEWLMEYCRNRENWDCLDFRGTLRECLDFLAEDEHYLFWEG